MTASPASGSSGCWPAFPYRDGWLGGDAAYSIPLGDGRTLWLFGDSFVGEPEQRNRQNAHFVHNSIALSRCDPSRGWEIDYHWGQTSNGVPHAFLSRDDPQAPDAWWWLFDGFLHDGRLYLGLLEVEAGPPSGALAMPFRFTGVQLARIPNPDEDPTQWEFEVVTLSPDDEALPASSMVVDGDHVYLFAFVEVEPGRYPRILTRLPLSALDGETSDVSAALETLATDGLWRPGLEVGQARVLMDDNATEMSVRHHAELGKWLALYNYPDLSGSFPSTRPSDAIWVRTAEALEGPWSEPRLLFRIPELDPDYAGGYDPNTGCYAAKEHGQFSSPARLTFTYVCNLFTGRGQDPNAILSRLVANMGLYRPIPVSVALPYELGAP